MVLAFKMSIPGCRGGRDEAEVGCPAVSVVLGQQAKGVCVRASARSVLLGLCSWSFCITVRRWGHEPLNKWEGAVGRGKGPRKNFLLGF